MVRLNSLKFHIKCVSAVLFLTFLYNEQLAYFFQTFHWPHINCKKNDKHCITILLVADPQLLGEKFDTRIFTSFARWDSDRYISITYKHAIRHLKPNVVLFLGDIMDEGSIADPEEYARYFKRLKSVFPSHDAIKYIFIPGDNDIGGEDDSVSLSKIERFHKDFGQNDVVTVNEFNFLKVNLIIHEIPKSKSLLNTTNIVISHMPILFTPGSFMKTVIEELNPAVIFAAHEHKSLYVGMNRQLTLDRQVNILSSNKQPVTEFTLDRNMIHEIIVPTCSYRMGVSQSGYGAAVIDGSGSSMFYGVLWQPSRFKLLYNYLYVLSAILVYMILIFTYLAIVLIFIVNTKYKRRYNKLNV